jgi:hypothetical protein
MAPDGHAADGRLDAVPRVGEDDVDPPEQRIGLVEEPPLVIGNGDIADHRDGPRARIAHGLGGLFELVRPPGEEGDIHARLRAVDGGRTADAAARAGNDDGLAFE